MGASSFSVRAKGKTAAEAFNTAVQDALYAYGHDGYTGSIAEKNSYKMISVPDDADPYDYAEKLIEEDDRRIADKYGPAGCIKLADGEYLFFGYAST